MHHPDLEILLNKLLRVRVKDGRWYFGSFICTDRNCDLILDNTTEKHDSGASRFLGMVVIRGHNIEEIGVSNI